MMPDFSIDYEEDTDTTVLFTHHGDRFVSLEFRPLPSGARAALHIKHGTFAPSLDRLRRGYRGSAAEDVAIEQSIHDARIDDVVRVLSWVMEGRAVEGVS